MTNRSRAKKERHGMHKFAEYPSWAMMKQRCSNSNTKAYKYYGGRGIRVCIEWQNSFKKFIEDMGRRPSGMSLDRIDTNGDYCKENCRWATIIVQANNTRDNKKIEYNGQIYGIRKLSEKCGVSQKLLAKRLYERGWSVERAMMNKSFIGRNQYSIEEK